MTNWQLLLITGWLAEANNHPKHICVCAYVMVCGGVPVAWHSSSRMLLMMTVACVILSAPSTVGGTEKEKIISNQLNLVVIHSFLGIPLQILYTIRPIQFPSNTLIWCNTESVQMARGRMESRCSRTVVFTSCSGDQCAGWKLFKMEQQVYTSSLKW